MEKSTASIWEQVHIRLRAFIAKRVRNEAEIEDLLQEVFVRVHRHIETIHEPERMVSWVFQITRNVIVDHYRSAAQKRELPAGTGTDIQEELKVMSVESEEHEAKYELSNCLRPMIARLSSAYREAIILVELEGLTHQEAATKLGLSLPGMKSRVQRGRQQLHNMLNECCQIELDGRHRIVQFEERRPGSC